jgi:hypothetical protein
MLGNGVYCASTFTIDTFNSQGNTTTYHNSEAGMNSHITRPEHYLHYKHFTTNYYYFTNLIQKYI